VAIFKGEIIMLNRYNSLLDNWFTTFSIPLDSDLHSLKDERLFFKSFPYESKEEEGHMILAIEMPGVKSSDLVIETVSNILNISGKQKGKSFNSSYSIHKNYDPSSCLAKLEDGILTLKFQRLESTKPKIHKIELS
jgi:HSP20 family molecular chaperone IbpA